MAKKREGQDGDIDAKVEQLRQRYGMFELGAAGLEASLKDDWLTHMKQFEDQLKTAANVTVYQFIGQPAYTRLSLIPTEQLSDRLEQLLNLLMENQIAIDFICDVAPEEMYRFITEELFLEKMDDIRIEGMYHCFIYEDFHPNDEYDVTFWATNFLDSLIRKDQQDVDLCLGRDALYDGQGEPVTFLQVQEYIAQFWERNKLMYNQKMELVECKVTGDEATTEVAMSWLTLREDPFDIIQITGRASLRLRRSPYSGWDVISFQLPGWY